MLLFVLPCNQFQNNISKVFCLYSDIIFIYSFIYLLLIFLISCMCFQIIFKQQNTQTQLILIAVVEQNNWSSHFKTTVITSKCMMFLHTVWWTTKVGISATNIKKQYLQVIFLKFGLNLIFVFELNENSTNNNNNSSVISYI